MNIIILLQIGNYKNIDMILYVLKIYKNLNPFYIKKLVICSSFLEDLYLSDKDKYFEILKKINPDITCFHENKGMDILPFINQMIEICDNKNYYDNSFDYIVKIHSKSKRKWLKELLIPLYDINNFFENKSIISSDIWSLSIDFLNTKKICEICELLDIKNIWYDEVKEYKDRNIEDLDCEFYSNYYDVKLNNINDFEYNKKYLFTHLILNNNIPNEKHLIRKSRVKNLKFVGGSVFAGKFELFYNFFKNKKDKFIILSQKLEEGYIDNLNETYTHSLERILSSFFEKDN